MGDLILNRAPVLAVSNLSIVSVWRGFLEKELYNGTVLVPTQDFDMPSTDDPGRL